MQTFKIFISILLIAYLPYCSTGNENTPTARTPSTEPVPDNTPLVNLDDSGHSIQGIETLANANNRFSLELYSELKDENEENIFFSSYSISTALMMTYEGARGDTEEEIRAVFHFTEDDQLRRANYAAVHNQLNLPNAKYSLSTANALWVQQDYTLLSDYIDVLKRYYAGEVTNLDFIEETEESRLTINNWVSDKTNEKIKDLLPKGSVRGFTRLILTNAISFKGIWKMQFKESDTRNEDFTLNDGRVIRAPLMSRMSEEVPYAETAELQILEMPYEGDDISMLVLLPKNGDLSSLEASLTIENLDRWRGLLSERKVEIYFPRFTFTKTYSLADKLAAMGMPSAFDADAADFSGITREERLFISKIAHKAFVDVNEEGTEAAAATGVVFSTTSAPPPPPVFRADHPFIFIIQKTEEEFVNGHILFMGRVNDPTQ